jgi:hypothetical protein
MGLGYELPDVYDVLAGAGWNPNSLPEGAARFRAAELKKVGKPAMLLSGSTGWEEVRGEYLNLRRDGEKVHESRLEYMNQRLEKGQHPDTHPAFWDKWSEPQFPTTVRVDIDYPQRAAADFVPVALAGLVLVGGIGTYVFMRRRG